MPTLFNRIRILGRYLPVFFKLLLEDGGDILLEDGTGHLMQE
jgi:hypothetical protein